MNYIPGKIRKNKKYETLVSPLVQSSDTCENTLPEIPETRHCQLFSLINKLHQIDAPLLHDNYQKNSLLTVDYVIAN